MGKQSHKAMPFMCGACKQGFGSEKALLQHIEQSHPTIHSCGVYRCIARVDGPECESRYGIEASPPTRAMKRAGAFGELLDALKHAVHWHDQITPADVARYEAVIAKAEGK